MSLSIPNDNSNNKGYGWRWKSKRKYSTTWILYDKELLFLCLNEEKNGDTKRVDGSIEEKGSVGSVSFHIIISISFHVFI